MKKENEGRVLLLDDERLVRFTISAWLKTTGFSVKAVSTPEEALDELRHGRYDVVLSDVVMGAMDGFMFRDTVRTFNETLPIIFLTSLVTDSSNTLMLRVTQDLHSYYVPKNARREYLLGRLRQIVKAERAELLARSLQESVEKDMALASRVQRSLLPSWSVYGEDGFYSCLWRPYSVVSGDLFEWLPVSDHAGVFVLGDISGHGIPAALAMTAVQSHLKRFVALGDVQARQPHLICREIDRFIHDNLRDIAYMAGLVMYVNYKENIVRYCNAGSIEPQCYLRTDGSCVDLNPEHRGSLPMGLVPEASYTEADVVTYKLPYDGVLCFYSDGYVDLTRDEEGEDRVPDDMLREIVGELVAGSSGTCDIGSLPYRLTAMLVDMGYTKQQDDMTVVVLGRTARHSGRFLSEVPMLHEESIDEVVQRAAAWAMEQKIEMETVVKIELLLNEHLVNIRKHGLDDYGRRHEIAVLEIRAVSDGVEIVTWDRGAPWTADVSEVAPHPDLKLEAQNRDMASSGRGIAILRKIAPRINYEAYEGLNRITFYIPAAKTTDTEGSSR